MYQPDAFTRLRPLAPAAPPDAAAAAAAREPVLIAYATQTGAAEGYAQATDEQLRAAGLATHLVEFYDLQLETLMSAHRALIIASTTYDGDPPDMAEEFARQRMAQPAPLATLQYGLLALGDSNYDTFCGFGRTLRQWLAASGAQPLFAAVEVDDENQDALDRWFQDIDAFIHADARVCASMRA